MRHGEGWLKDHPMRDIITKRYLKHQTRLTRMALSQIMDEEDNNPDEEDEKHQYEEDKLEKPLSLNDQRIGSVISVLKSIQAKRVVDMGCGEGMVVKSLDFLIKYKKGLLQPAIKCRGREYLRIIYGLDYTLNHHLDVLRNRGLGKKRSLAIREFALGIEALQRFVRKEPLYRIHECVFGILCLESEAIDPRL